MKNHQYFALVPVSGKAERLAAIPIKYRPKSARSNDVESRQRFVHVLVINVAMEVESPGVLTVPEYESWRDSIFRQFNRGKHKSKRSRSKVCKEYQSSITLEQFQSEIDEFLIETGESSKGAVSLLAFGVVALGAIAAIANVFKGRGV